MTEHHGYWPAHGYGHYVHHPMAPHSAHLYMGPPHYPPVAPQYLTHPSLGHGIYGYPHPTPPQHGNPPHPATVHHQHVAPQPHHSAAHQVHHHHYHNHRHHGHTLHVRMITISEDVTRVQWIWHITDHVGVLIKSTTKIHDTFTQCVEDAGTHAEAVSHAPHVDDKKKIWSWQISDHSGYVISTSANLHKTFGDCIMDVRGHGEPKINAV